MSGVVGRIQSQRKLSAGVEAYLLTYSMVQSPSWEANWFAASQEIPRILRNPKVHYRTHKPPPPVPILGQPNPVHIPTSHLLEIHPNIIHPSTPWSPQRSLPLGFPHQHPVHSSPFPHTGHMPRLSHSSRFYHPHNIGWWIVWLFIRPKSLFTKPKSFIAAKFQRACVRATQRLRFIQQAR